MGTRNLTIVHQAGQYKVAQYGQFDGYPRGQGKTVLEFLRTWDRPSFEQKIAAASYLTPAEIESINQEIQQTGRRDNWQTQWPELSRNTAAKVLDLIATRPPGIKLVNQLAFAGDSLMCEWAYLIDLDTGKLEVFKGFNTTPLTPDDRFYHVPDLERSSNASYHPIKRVAVYDFAALPTVEQMDTDCQQPED